MAAAITSKLTDIITSEDWQRQLAEMKKRAELISKVFQEPDTNIPDEFDYASLAGIILTAVNGTGDVREQRIRVQYLSQEKVLSIPAGLAVHPLEGARSEAIDDRELRTLIRKAMGMTFANIVELVNSDGTMAAKRQAFADVEGPVVTEFPGKWDTPEFYVGPDGAAYDYETSSLVFAAFSRLLKLNYDIRDAGFLVLKPSESRLQDNAWMTFTEFNSKRLSVKVKPYTLECIAALNLAACDRYHLGAWVRAIGVGCGCLPVQETRLNKEWKFTKRVYAVDDLNEIRKVHGMLGIELPTFCLNVLGMFGLFHLNKNHTFKSNDQNMDRICTSYIMTLRTMVDDTVMTNVRENMEVMCRTAAHPFGLGQTYWIALYLGRFSSLASPLAIRRDVCPPTVQRLMVIQAATIEWTGFPIGEVLNKLYKDFLGRIKDEIAKIREAPPHYSDLARLYGYDDVATVKEDVKEAIDVMMPIITGYAYATHTRDNDVKDGIALALSLTNVTRESRTATEAYRNLWVAYMDSIDSRGLEEFVKHSLDFTAARGTV